MRRTHISTYVEKQNREIPPRRNSNLFQVTVNGYCIIWGKEGSSAELRVCQSLTPRSPAIAEARAAVCKNLDILVGKAFGPGLFTLLKQFTCVIIMVDFDKQAIETIRIDPDRIEEG